MSWPIWSGSIVVVLQTFQASTAAESDDTSFFHVNASAA